MFSLFFFFFFSSRRRHTRFDCDWSSDVCSSDLLGGHSAVVGDEDDGVARVGQLAQQGHDLGAAVRVQRARGFVGQDDLAAVRSEEHTSELQSQSNLVCRLLLEKKKKKNTNVNIL